LVNGLALRLLHHKTFGLGAFAVADGVVIVPDRAHGTAGFQEWLMAHNGRPLSDPPRPARRPEPGRRAWPGREVFKGEARHRG